MILKTVFTLPPTSPFGFEDGRDTKACKLYVTAATPRQYSCCKGMIEAGSSCTFPELLGDERRVFEHPPLSLSSSI